MLGFRNIFSVFKVSQPPKSEFSIVNIKFPMYVVYKLLHQEEMNYFSMDYGIQLIISTPFYAQANGQAEASNKVLIGILEKMLKKIPKIGMAFYQRHCGHSELPKGVLQG